MLAGGFDRFGERNLAAVHLDALLLKLGGDVAVGDRTEHLAALADPHDKFDPRSLAFLCYSFRSGAKLGIPMQQVLALVLEQPPVESVLRVGNALGHEKVAGKTGFDIDHIPGTSQVLVSLTKNDLHFSILSTTSRQRTAGSVPVHSARTAISLRPREVLEEARSTRCTPQQRSSISTRRVRRPRPTYCKIASSRQTDGTSSQ